MKVGNRYICDDCLASPYMPSGSEKESEQQFKGVDVCQHHLEERRKQSTQAFDAMWESHLYWMRKRNENIV